MVFWGKTAAAALVALSAACTTAWISAYNREQERKEALRPEHKKKPTRSHTFRAIRCRAWAGVQFREQNVDWQGEIERQFEEANRVLQTAYARFELVELRPWERSGGRSLESDLTALQQRDDGRDVDFVMGFVAALPLFTDDLHTLGLAWLTGRHGITRSIDDNRELEALMRQLQFSSRDEVEQLVSQRTQHKKGVIIVHEWAHAMGATHRTGAPEFLMKPVYTVDMARFSPENGRVIEIALEHRVGAAADDDEWRRALVAYLETSTDPEQRELLAALRSVAPAGEAAPWQGIAQGDLAELNAIVDEFNAGRAEQAWSRLSVLRERYRDDPEMQTLSCEVAMKVPAVDGRSICQLARLVANEDPRPPAALFLAASSGIPSAETLGLLRDACERIPSGRYVNRGWWAWFARLAAQHGGCACAETALARADESERAAVTAAIAEARNRFGLVFEKASSLTDELELVRMTREVDALLEQKQLGAAEKLANDAAARWSSAGTSALLCEVHGHRKRYAAARGECQAALARQPENARAAFVLAVLELHAGNARVAAGLLEQSVANAPSSVRSWVLLGQVYQSLGRGGELGELRERFRARHARAAPF